MVALLHSAGKQKEPTGLRTLRVAHLGRGHCLYAQAGAGTSQQPMPYALLAGVHAQALEPGGAITSETHLNE